jgi:hypothetical protein
MNKKENKKDTTLIQITLFDINNKYKPVSTLIEVESVEWFRKHIKECKLTAIKKICLQRGWTGKQLLELGYKKIKARNYTLWKELQKKEVKK